MKKLANIGSGGFGNVDRVELENGDIFARKCFARNQQMDERMFENVRKRFLREVEIQGTIEHVNIVRIVSSDLNSDPPYYLMPEANSTLAQDLENDRELGGDFVSVIADIVAGLSEIHSIQIFHRDLKPQNVLRFDKPNDSGVNYAISDFGLISMNESKLSKLTNTGMRKGSDYYTAPEITKDFRMASIQSDIYSLGCILHDMIGIEDRVPCGEIRETGPYSDILLGCTRKDPKQRFKSAKEFLDALASVEYESQANLSKESQDFVDILKSASPPASDFWDDLADYLESGADNEEVSGIFHSLLLDRISNLVENNSYASHRIGVCFADWVARGSFDFDYCDPLTNRLEAFYGTGNFDLMVQCLKALLEMGTSHNRWYVERTFIRLCGSDMDENFAKRLAMEFRIWGREVCDLISKLEDSISMDRTHMHPLLGSVLSEICR